MDVAKIDDWLFPNELPVGEELIKKISARPRLLPFVNKVVISFPYHIRVSVRGW